MASHDSESLDSLPDAPPVHHGHKSYKRKFAKMKIKFEYAMKESNSLIKEELRIVDLAKRLKEQNDQLMELLLDFNGSIRIPPSLRYKLTAPDDSIRGLQESDDVPTMHCDPVTARERLVEAKERLLAAEISPDECRQLEESMLRSRQFSPAEQFTSLLKVPHTENAEPTAADGDIGATLGFLSPEHETEYANTMDSGAGIVPRASGQQSSGELDREAAHRNPVSVQNWLKKHQPNALHHHDGESVAEKPPTRSAGARTSKRATAQAQREEDLYDEDGILLDIPATGGGGGGGGGSGGGGGGGAGRGKRKRDEDGGYRPKGGSSGRSKKKKDDTGAGAKRSKRASAADTTG